MNLFIRDSGKKSNGIISGIYVVYRKGKKGRKRKENKHVLLREREREMGKKTKKKYRRE